MEKITKQDPQSQSADIVAENIEKLLELFPDISTEGSEKKGIDFATLKEILGEYAEESEERYNFTWHGKSRARRLAQTPSAGTLRPYKGESADWDNTQNLFIEGDNLEALKLLQKSYHKKVKVIYIDPPYNTGKEFIYPDKYQDNLDTYLRYTGQINDEGFKVTANTESSGRYHTNWLNMMYARLRLARNLLSDDGVIFVSIGSEELKNAISLLQEIFGEENEISLLTWEQGRKNDSTFFSESADYIVAFAKNRALLSTYGPWRERKEGVDSILHFHKEATVKYNGNHASIEQEMREFYQDLDEEDPRKKLKHFYRSDDTGLFFGADISSASTSIPDYDIMHPDTNKPVKKPARGWGATEPVMLERIKEGRVLFGVDESTIPLKKSYLMEVDSIVKTPVIYKDGRAASGLVKKLFGAAVFTNPKDHYVLSEFIEYALQGESNAIVLDFFAGSASTAHAVLHLNSKNNSNLKFIMVQLPEDLHAMHDAATGTSKNVAKNAIDYLVEKKLPQNLCEIGKERIRLAAQAIKKDIPDFSGDSDFKVFKLDATNIVPWEADFDTIENQLSLSIDSIKTDRSSEDVLYEILLKYGLDLTLPIKEHNIGGKTLYNVGMGALIVCLDDLITIEAAEGIGKLKDELQPEVMRVVFKDAGFADDVVKTNAVQVLKQFGIDDVRSI